MMGAASYCRNKECGRGLPWSNYRQASSNEHECLHCGRINPANRTPADVIEELEDAVKALQKGQGSPLDLMRF